MRRLPREHEPLELALGVLGIENHQLVAVRRHREVAEQRTRLEVVLLRPHAAQARMELLAQELLPLLALHAAPAPVELEQHVQVEVREHLVEVYVDLLHTPERRLGHRQVGAGGAPHGVVVGRQLLRLLALLAQLPRLRAGLLHEACARVAVDELVDHVQALEGVLAVEDARLVDLVGRGPVRVEDAAAEVAVDGRAADEHGELESLCVELLHRSGHLLGRRHEQS